jgi:hypothetical protein
MIKILNRRENGNLFHYAHFICDCLFPEIVMNMHKNKRIIREKSISQTLGNFLQLYCRIMNCECMEIDLSLFDSLKTKLYINEAKENLIHPIYFEKFRNFIFNRFDINSQIFYPKYPSVILIQRGKRIKLINDPELEDNNNNYTNGAERREINNIEKVKIFMKQMFGDDFQTLILENILFEQQIQYFNNAKIIICAHGACMSNLFFCKKDTILFEVTCGESWPFFDIITQNLQIIHHKIKNNNFHVIINRIVNEKILSLNEYFMNKSVIEELNLHKKINSNYQLIKNKQTNKQTNKKTNKINKLSNRILYTTGNETNETYS